MPAIDVLHFVLPGFSLLLPGPLALRVLGYQKGRPGGSPLRWATPLAGVLLAVAAVSVGAGIIAGGPAVAEGTGDSGAGEPPQRPGGEFLTRTITYTHNPLRRLTGAYSSGGKSHEYACDAVGNRTAYTVTTPLAGTVVITYTYDAANRLLASASGGHIVPYTWDARGNLIGDSTFTCACNAAGRLVRAQSITATVIYTYTADGLRVAQSLEGETTLFAWDWASGVLEMLSDGGSRLTPVRELPTRGWRELYRDEKTILFGR